MEGNSIQLNLIAELPGSKLYTINKDDKTSYIIGEGVLEIYEVPQRQITFLSLSPIFQYVLGIGITTVKGRDKRYLLPTDDRGVFYGLTLDPQLKDDIALVDTILSESTKFSVETSLTDKFENAVKKGWFKSVKVTEDAAKEGWGWIKKKFSKEDVTKQEEEKASKRPEPSMRRSLRRASLTLSAKRKAKSTFLISEADLDHLMNFTTAVQDAYQGVQPMPAFDPANPTFSPATSVENSMVPLTPEQMQMMQMQGMQQPMIYVPTADMQGAMQVFMLPQPAIETNGGPQTGFYHIQSCNP